MLETFSRHSAEFTATLETFSRGVFNFAEFAAILETFSRSGFNFSELAAMLKIFSGKVLVSQSCI